MRRRSLCGCSVAQLGGSIAENVSTRVAVAVPIRVNRPVSPTPNTAIRTPFLPRCLGPSLMAWSNSVSANWARLGAGLAAYCGAFGVGAAGVLLELLTAQSLDRWHAYTLFLNLGAVVAAVSGFIFAGVRRPQNVTRMLLILAAVVLLCGFVSAVARGEYPLWVVRTIRYSVFFLRLPGAVLFGSLAGVWAYRKLVQGS